MIWSALTSTTPGRLRIASAVLVALGLLAGGIGFLTYQARAADLRTAQAATTQLVRLQQIRTDLVAADAIATNAFLVGGLEPDGSRAQYLERIQEASTLLVQARAAAGDREGEILASANASLTTYTGLVESARANNRQGYPVGIGYLKNASGILRSQVLQPLAEVSADDAEGIPATLGASWQLAMLPVLLVVLGVGVAVQVWLRRITRRILNTGLVGASTVLVTGALVLLGVHSYTSASLDALETGDYADTVSLSKARIAAFDAKANESLTLISRGNGTTYEAAWRASSAEAIQAASQLDQYPELAASLRSWGTVHAQIRAMDDSGRWEQAVTLATSTTTPNSTGKAFNDFDSRSASALEASTAGVDAGYRSPIRTSSALAYILLVAGVVAAASSTVGLNARIKEYK